MDVFPDTTEPDDAEVQDDLAACECPRHARALEALREDHFTGGLGDTAADGQLLPSVGLIAHPPTALFEVGVGLIKDLGLS